MTTPRTLNQHYTSALARFAPGRIAYGFEKTAVTFGELAAAVDALSASLARRGVGASSVVGYSLPNCPEVFPLFLALARLGARAVPLFPMIPDAARARIFTAFGCSLVIAPAAGAHGLAEAARSMQAPYRVLALEELTGGAAADSASVPAPDFPDSPERTLLAAASSGTTGASKSVWITHRNAAAVLTASADLARVGPWQVPDPSFTTMAAFPMSTSSALVILGLLFAGVRAVLSRDFSPVHFLELAEHWQVEALSAPPAYFESILNLPPELRRPVPSVRAVFAGMDFLHSGLLARLGQCFTGLECAASGYGLVETSTVFMAWKAHDREAMKRPASTFALSLGVNSEIDVRDEQGKSLPPREVGELWVRGDSVVSGYLGNSEENARAFVDGWFRTGDVAARIDERTIELGGRRKYLIKRGGKSVAPTEVQEKLDVCPGVRESAVVGVKHPLYGEMIWAFVVADRAQPATLRDLMKASRATLPTYMVPDHVTFVDELPRGSGVGKLDRETMIRMAEAELLRTIGENRV